MSEPACTRWPVAAPMSTSLPLWTPSPERVAGSQLDAFRRLVAERHDVDLPDSRALHRWSVDHLDECWRRCGTASAWSATPGDVAFDPGDGTMLGARFFPGARLNLAENLLAGPAEESDPAIVFVREDGQRRMLTWAQLRVAVATTAAALRAAGVGVGRPGGGLDAQPARDGRRLPRRERHRRGLLVDLGRLRCGRRRRPLRPDRAHGAVRRRRLPLRREALRLPRPPARDPGRAAHPGARGGRREPVRRTRPPSAAPASGPSPTSSPARRTPRSGRRPSNGSPSTTRPTSSTPRARPASRSASCTAAAACW